MSGHAELSFSRQLVTPLPSHTRPPVRTWRDNLPFSHYFTSESCVQINDHGVGRFAPHQCKYFPDQQMSLFTASQTTLRYVVVYINGTIWTTPYVFDVGHFSGLYWLGETNIMPCR